MKFEGGAGIADYAMSSPTRGMWIEIDDWGRIDGRAVRSSPTRGMWIEMATTSPLPDRCLRSSPTRGMWIEILL